MVHGLVVLLHSVELLGDEDRYEKMNSRQPEETINRVRLIILPQFQLILLEIDNFFLGGVKEYVFARNKKSRDKMIAKRNSKIRKKIQK